MPTEPIADRKHQGRLDKDRPQEKHHEEHRTTHNDKAKAWHFIITIEKDSLAIDFVKGKAYMKFDECWYCMPCEKDCPTGAVHVDIDDKDEVKLVFDEKQQTPKPEAETV